MNMTTCAILRRITETDLSVSAHNLATIILDGIAWKNGYNGLERGTAAVTLAHLAEKMAVSRQHLTALLSELADSALSSSAGSQTASSHLGSFVLACRTKRKRFQISCQPQMTHHYLETLRTKLSS